MPAQNTDEKPELGSLGTLTLVSKFDKVVVPIYKDEEVRNFHLLMEKLVEPDIYMPPTEAEGEILSARWTANKQAVRDLRLTNFGRVAQLDDSDLEMIVMLLDLIELGNHSVSDGNWLLSWFMRLASEIVQSGPAATVSAGPAKLVRAMADVYRDFQYQVDDAERLIEAYPELFPQLATPSTPEGHRAPKKRPCKGKKAARKGAGRRAA